MYTKQYGSASNSSDLPGHIIATTSKGDHTVTVVLNIFYHLMAGKQSSLEYETSGYCSRERSQ